MSAKHNGKSASHVLLDLKDVTRVYEGSAGSFMALKKINIKIDAGEFLAVVGRSGSGKSTLLNMLTGIDRPTTGEIYVNQTALHELNEDQLSLWRGKNVGIVFQFFQLLPTLTVLENVMLAMDFVNTIPVRKRQQRAMDLLTTVEIADQAHKLPSSLSGGQQQRVAIARALANDPPLIVADEPTGNLDSRTADAIFKLFTKLVESGKTVLIVTHEREISQWVNRTILLEDGHVVDENFVADAPQLEVAYG